MSRSFLFVPADNERKLAKADLVNADALILDLEDAVLPEAKPAARQLARDFLADEHRADIWVRVNPLNSDDALEDLRVVVPGGPSGIVLPKPESARDVNQLSRLLDVLEQEGDVELGQTGILPIVTETPRALFQLDEYASSIPRLRGLTWGAEDLSTALGAQTNRDAEGRWLPPYELARSLTLMAAAAAGVAAIDTVFTDFRAVEKLTHYVAAARRDGFSGMLAIHPGQVDIINAAFVPSAAEIEHAQSVVSLFADNPGAGALGLNGQMVDRPHLLQAERLLEIVSKLDRNAQ